jgi:hypothetical protein
MGAVFRLARGAGTGREAGFERGPGATGAPGRPHRAAAAGTTSKEGATHGKFRYNVTEYGHRTGVQTL